ncbi:MAG: phage terminase large subunit [bacterium]|nr:phage terminase large subunit [bacterium]
MAKNHLPWRPWENEFPSPYGHDFRNFLQHAWKVLGLPKPTPIQYDIAHYLQFGPDRQIIEGYRGVGKSWITGAFGLWAQYETYLCTLHGEIPKWETNILLLSAAEVKAKEFSSYCMALMREMDEIRWLMPVSDGKRQSVLGWDVEPARPSQTPSVRAGGIFSQITGSRADCIIQDDVEVPNNSDSQLKREKLLHYVQEPERILKPGGCIKLLGTPQSEETIYNVLPQRGYSKRIWPVRFPTEDQRDAYGSSLAPAMAEVTEAEPQMAGRPSDPDRFDDDEILKREAGQGRSGFALQYMLDPRISDALRYPLKLSDLVVMDCDPKLAPEKVIYASGPDQEIKDLTNVGFSTDRWYRPMAVKGDWVPYTGVAMAVDPSGRGGDELAYAVGGMLNGYLYLLDAGGFYGVGYSDEVLIELAEIAKKWSTNYVVLEQNFGDGMFERLWNPHLRRIYPVTVEEVRHNVQKERRIIDTIEPIANQHRLIVNRQVIEDDWRQRGKDGIPEEELQRHRLFHQYTRITKERGCLAMDDRVDALAMLVAYWVELMGADEEDEMKERRRELLNVEIERYMESIGEPSPFEADILDRSLVTGFE